jgi:hypothetical protein
MLIQTVSNKNDHIIDRTCYPEDYTILATYINRAKRYVELYWNNKQKYFTINADQSVFIGDNLYDITGDLVSCIIDRPGLKWVGGSPLKSKIVFINAAKYFLLSIRHPYILCMTEDSRKARGFRVINIKINRDLPRTIKKIKEFF